MMLWRDRASTSQKESVTKEFDGSKVDGLNGSKVDGSDGPVWHEESPPLSKPAGRVPRDESRESVIAADLTIEGKIEGAGHVRIAGRFKGDIHVEGNLTIEEGAQLAGEIRADTIIIAGELQGNIQAASRVELLETGTITGDLNAGSLTTAAGSRMRGKAEFGWNGRSAAPFETNNRDGSTL
jgi:cytoskeletal protein CcmA (bactofilin family)